ncbi:hypothetical protein G9A89_005155 [Geosiphon pyriformis]|nr:hypothetical protein G9A89_005155 [Geosiphon pyriformis]
MKIITAYETPIKDQRIKLLHNFKFCKLASFQHNLNVQYPVIPTLKKLHRNE